MSQRAAAVANETTACGDFQPLSSVGLCISCSDRRVARPGYLCVNHSVQRCPIGHYCPYSEQRASYDTALLCPEGSICMPGFVEPKQCGHRNWVKCIKGAHHIYPGVGLLAVLCGMISVAMTLCCLLNYRRNAQLKASARVRDGHRPMAEILARSAISGTQSSRLQSEQQDALGHAFKAFTAPVHFMFNDVGMKLKSNGKVILEGVTGYYPPASLVALMGPVLRSPPFPPPFRPALSCGSAAQLCLFPHDSPTTGTARCTALRARWRRQAQWRRQDHLHERAAGQGRLRPRQRRGFSLPPPYPFPSPSATNEAPAHAHGTIAPRAPPSHPEWICITQRGTNSSGCACPCPRAHSVCGCSRGRPFPMQVTINGVEDGLTKASNVVGFVPQVRSNALLFCVLKAYG